MPLICYKFILELWSVLFISTYSQRGPVLHWWVHSWADDYGNDDGVMLYSYLPFIACFKLVPNEELDGPAVSAL
jgi:hypothetical protein